LVAAVVAEETALAGLGLDAEPAVPLPDGVLEVIARPDELGWMRVLPHGGKVLVSAKEAVFKAVFPLMRAWIDFHDVRILPDLEGWSFRVKPYSTDAQVSSALERLSGRFSVTAHFVLAGCAIPRSGNGES
jgi:4'-phosphopantetheinyl transferase EntD